MAKNKSNMFSFIMLFLFTCLFSCNEDDGGKSWDPQLSANSLIFNYEAGKQSITSKKDIQEIRIPQIENAEDTNCTISYDDNNKIEKIEGEWYTIQLVSKNSISVQVKINETSINRSIFLPVLRGNYYGGVTIVQEGKN